MKSRVGKFLLVAALIVPFIGCPGGAGIRLGEWIFELDEDGTLYPVVLNFDGTAVVPAGPVPTLHGTLTWVQDGLVFELSQEISGDVWLYSSTMLSRTSMEGIVTGPNPSTWTAYFAG